jgi:hypothetical protein
MTEVSPTNRRRGSTLDRNRRRDRAGADARNTRIGASSDLVVAAYIRELAKSARPPRRSQVRVALGRSSSRRQDRSHIARAA